MRKRTMFWGIFILALALIATSLAVRTSADSTPISQKPFISVPAIFYGEVGVPLNATLTVTGDGNPLPELSFSTPTIREGITVAISTPTLVGTTKFTAKLTISGTPTKPGRYIFGIKAQNSRGSDVEHIFIDVKGSVAVTGVSISPTNPPAMPPGDSIYLTATLTPTNATNQVVTWKSSNTNVATVDASGFVKAVSNGQATITATTQDGNKTASTTITVQANVTPVAIQNINVAPATVKLSVGETHTLNVHFNPVDATSQDISWSSSAPGVVSVAADGTIVGLTPGEADVKATSVAAPSKTSSARVVVRERFVNVSGVSVTPQTLNLYHHASNPGTAYLTAKITPFNASNQTVTWTSSGVVTVDSNGLVTTAGVGTGTVTVTTEDGGHSATTDITVKAANVTIPVSGVTLEPASVTLNSGAVRSLVATISPSNATDQSVTWTTGNASVATIANDGVLTAVSGGSTTITVTTANGKTAACDVTVLAPHTYIAATSLTLFPVSANVPVSGNLLISYDIAPVGASNKIVSWKSSNPAVAAVDSIGLVTGVSKGLAVITGTTQDGNKTATCAITVIDRGAGINVTGVAVNPKALTLKVDESAIVNALITPSNANDQQVEWSSSAPLVASVAADGTVIGLSPGMAIITVKTKDGSKTDTCTVTVGANAISVSAITLSAVSMNATVGQTLTLSLTFTPSNATNKGVYWTSSNPAIAIVDAKGNVRFISSGTVVITATTQDGEKQASCTITVTAPGAIPVYALQVVPSEWGMYPEDQKLLGIIFFPNSATSKGLIWSSSNNALATVDTNGLVTAVAAGYVEITATVADNPAKTSTCGIAVLMGASQNIAVGGVSLLTPVMNKLEVGQTRKCVAEINPPTAKNQEVRWETSNPAVATVGTDGLVTIVGPGAVTITVHTHEGDYTDSVTFTVPGGGSGGGSGGSSGCNSGFSLLVLAAGLPLVIRKRRS